MSRTSVWSIVLGALLTTAISVNAGGWAVITLDSLPDAIEVGKPTALAYTVRQHGVTPLGGLNGTIEAVAGQLRVTAKTAAGPGTGRYVGTLTLPRAGNWSITIDSGFLNSRLTLIPVTAVDDSARASQALATAERGRRLFVAKGCVTCHPNDLGTSNPSVRIGPALIPGKYQAAFLGRILTDPATIPSTNQLVRMPNLHLQPQEVASLVAFINGEQVVAVR